MHMHQTLLPLDWETEAQPPGWGGGGIRGVPALYLSAKYPNFGPSRIHPKPLPTEHTLYNSLNFPLHNKHHMCCA
jgi:hypothetical protein